MWVRWCVLCRVDLSRGLQCVLLKKVICACKELLGLGTCTRECVSYECVLVGKKVCGVLLFVDWQRDERMCVCIVCVIKEMPGSDHHV